MLAVWRILRIRSSNSRDVTKRGKMDGNSIVSGRHYDILTSIITKLLMSRTFGDLSWFARRVQHFWHRPIVMSCGRVSEWWFNAVSATNAIFTATSRGRFRSVLLVHRNITHDGKSLAEGRGVMGDRGKRLTRPIWRWEPWWSDKRRGWGRRQDRPGVQGY